MTNDYISNFKAYDEVYLDGAMIRLGDMLEYACLDCGYDPDSFWKMFIHSGVSRKFGIGDFSIVAGKSGPEIARLVLFSEDHRTTFPEPSWREDRSEFYWCGWVLAYYQWYTSQSFEKIWNDISIRTLQKCYITLHEADISKTVEIMKSLQKSTVKQPLATLRIIRGFTQKELAERANMSISQLQRLEYGDRKTENLTLKTALALANALSVSINEL